MTKRDKILKRSEGKSMTEKEILGLIDLWYAENMGITFCQRDLYKLCCHTCSVREINDAIKLLHEKGVIVMEANDALTPNYGPPFVFRMAAADEIVQWKKENS